jgi:ketosteroid isomerase-like protein
MYSWIVGRLIRRAYREAVAGKTRLAMLLAGDDVRFTFPGNNSFAGTYVGKTEFAGWLSRFAALTPDLVVEDVVASGAPWDLRVGMRFVDSIGEDYRNEGMEYLRIRFGKLREVQVYLDTETIAAWEARHPELRAGSVA